MRIRMRQIEEAIDTLDQIRHAATFEDAMFTAPGNRFPGSGPSRMFTDDVRAHTAEYRALYMLEPLSEVIDALRAEVARASRTNEEHDAPG